MNEVAIMTSSLIPFKGSNCTKIRGINSYLKPVLAYRPWSDYGTSLAEFGALKDAIGFCQVFDRVEVDEFCIKLPTMPKYKPMPEKGMIKRPLSLEEAREQMILLGE